MARSMLGRRVPSAVIRGALTRILAAQTEPATARDLTTAVYHLTGEDRVSSEKVGIVLRRMAADGQARKTDDGLWVGVSS